MTNYPPSPAPLSDRDTYTTWPGGVDPTARVYAGGKRRKASTRKSRSASRKNTRKTSRKSTRKTSRKSTRKTSRKSTRKNRKASTRRGIFQYMM